MPKGIHNGARGAKPSVPNSVEVGTVRLSPATIYAATLAGNGDRTAGIRTLLARGIAAGDHVYIDVTHPTIGAGILTDDHATVSYGQPVLVRHEGGAVYGPGDVPPGALTEPIPGAWSASDRERLAWWSAGHLGPMRWEVAGL